MFVPLVVLGCLVLAVWLTLAAGVTLPLWYWAPFDHFPHGLTVHGVQLGYFPNGPSGHGAVGVYVDTLPKALLTAVVCLVLLVRVQLRPRPDRAYPRRRRPGPAPDAGRPAGAG